MSLDRMNLNLDGLGNQRAKDLNKARLKLNTQNTTLLIRMKV